MAKALKFWGIFGFVLAAVGAVMAMASWPGTETDYNVSLGGVEPVVTETGNEVDANVGLMLLGVGSTMLWVVLIALGVYCGLQMHQERGQISSGGATRPLDNTTAERLNREAQQRIAAKRAAEKNDGS